MQEPFYPLPASDGERHDMRGVGRDVQKLDDADSRPGTQWLSSDRQCESQVSQSRLLKP